MTDYRTGPPYPSRPYRRRGPQATYSIIGARGGWLRPDVEGQSTFDLYLEDVLPDHLDCNECGRHLPRRLIRQCPDCGPAPGAWKSTPWPGWRSDGPGGILSLPSRGPMTDGRDP